MGAPAAIVARMRDRVTLAVMSGIDAYGKRTYATGRSMRCRIEPAPSRTWPPGNEETDASSTIYTAGDLAGFTPEGKVTLPDATEPPVKSLARHQWPDGTNHMVITL